MGGKKSTTTQKAEPWSAAQPYLTAAMGQAEDIFNRGGFSAMPFAGQRVAGPGEATQGAWQDILSMSKGGAPGTSASRSAMMDMLSGGQQYRGMDQVRQNILGSAIPQATAMFSGSGMTNSSTAQEGVGRAASEALAPFEYGAFENAQGRAMQAASMLPGLDAAMYMPATMAQGVGAQQDAARQAQINAEMQKYYEGQGQEAQNFSPYLQAIMGLGGMGGTQTTTSPQQGTGLGPAITGGLGTFGALSGIGALSGTSAPLWGGILSGLAALCDRHSKTDIKRIGALDSGTPVYRFRYKGHEKWHIGVMADEVPSAVVGNVAGYDVIDYGRVQ